MIFQSTRPLRGATYPRCHCGPDSRISIHAPLAGRDNTEMVRAILEGRFQSTRPLRGATEVEPRAGGMREISIHAPLAGRDDFGCNAGYDTLISIHAPLAGRDILFHLSTTSSAISIHAPLAGRDAVRGGCSLNWEFISIHAPLAGRDTPAPESGRPPTGFQSTRPLRGATQSCWKTTQIIWNFNPRAPCGARPGTLAHCIVEAEFQSTRPLRGATVGVEGSMEVVLISIHAPLAGRDPSGSSSTCH